MTANTHLYPQTLPTLHALKDAGALCCIASTKTRSRIGETLRKYQMESLIDLVVGVEDVAEGQTGTGRNQRRLVATSAWIKRTSSTSVTIPSTPEPPKMPASPLPP